MKILGFMGTACSGKSTMANGIIGCVLQNEGVAKDWRLNNAGLIEVMANIVDEDGTTRRDYHVFPTDLRSTEFVCNPFYQSLWKRVKNFSLAYPLKQSCKSLFRLTNEQVFGSDKGTDTEWTWGQFSTLLDKKEQKRIKEEKLEDKLMTAREVMEYYGTGVLRKLDEDIFVKGLVSQLQNETTNLALVTDVRRANEAKILRDNGAFIIRLLRGEEPKISESDINEAEVDLTLDNRELTMEEALEQVLNFMTEKDLLNV